LIAGWMAYAVAVGGLLGAAAWLIEPVLRGRRGPARLPWSAALALSTVIPLSTFLLVGLGPGPDAASAPASSLLSLAAVGRESLALPSLAGRLDAAGPWLVAAWLVASTTLAVALAGGLLRLSRRARRWPSAMLGEGEVLLSDGFGPALVGIRAPRVVLPSWTLGLEADRLRLVLLHEEEHRRAGDGRLLLAGTLAVVLAPWNVPLWWQLRRMRAAVELDCDARVLRRGTPPAAYGALLLELGTHVPGLPFSVAALSASRSLLERRLSMIVRGTRPRGPVGTFLAAGAAALLVFGACEAPSPTGVRPVGGDPEARAGTLTPGSGSVHYIVEGAAGAQPMVFVDGQRAPGGVPAGLDPADIERIEVVKGAAAVRLFGPEAKDGVIQVFTKAGSADTIRADTIRADPAHADARREIPGTASVRGTPTDATVYLDGALFEGDVSTLDPATIARIDVVKGGSTGSIIRITTKKAAGGGEG
jgi:hypothetical protein